VTKEILGLPPDQTFWVPDEVREFYGQQITRGAERRAAWTERFAAWDGDRAAWEAAQAGHGLPAGPTTCPASTPAPSWPPVTPSTSASTPRRPSCRVCWPDRPT
jgi:transketolase